MRHWEGRAGRGSLAGPLVAAAVMLPEGFDTGGIDDSKAFARKRGRRRAAYERIVETAAYSVCSVAPEVIDREGLHACNIDLLRRAAQGLDPHPDFILIDGPVLPPGMQFPARTIVHGDRRSASIAAASIVAKVTQERFMDELRQMYPDYGFDTNRGYGPAAWVPLEEHGAIPNVHRFSIKRIRELPVNS